MADSNRPHFPQRRHYSPEHLAKDKPYEDKLLAELEAMHAAARRKETPKTTSSPIALRAAIAKQIHNTEPKTMPDDKRDSESHDITSRLLNHFRKNPPDKQAIAKVPLQQPAADVNSRVQSHPKGGQLPDYDVNRRMQERYKGNPLVSPQQGPSRGPVAASSTMSLENQRRLSALIKNRGVDRELAAEMEEERQSKIIAERRNRRLGLR